MAPLGSALNHQKTERCEARGGGLFKSNGGFGRRGGGNMEVTIPKSLCGSRRWNRFAFLAHPSFPALCETSSFQGGAWLGAERQQWLCAQAYELVLSPLVTS